MSSDALPVYVIHYRSPEWCRKTVASLRNSDVPLDITVINNGGDLDQMDVQVVDAPGNVGYAGAANIAIAIRPDAPLIVITSHDVDVAPGAMRRLLEAARAYPDAAVLGANVGSGGKTELGRSDDVAWLEWTSGTCLLIRRACLDEIGNFDARLHSYCEDVDLGRRANDAGWRVGKVARARATERGSSMGSSYARRLIRANWLLLDFKRMGWPGLFQAATAQALLSAKIAGWAISHPADARKQIPIAWDNFAALFIALRRLPAFIRTRPLNRPGFVGG